MLYLESQSTDPYFNLALEEYIFEKLDRKQQYFLLWHNDNTIVVGKYQNTAEEINSRYVEEHGIRVVRRLSGGGAVYHDKGNLNFTFIVDQDCDPDFNFEVFVVPVVKALEEIGVHAEFSGRNDITINGKKFSGNSQYARRGRLLHHGCIMLDSNLTNVTDALKPKEAKFSSKSVKSVRSRVTTINANAPEPVTMDQFRKLLKKHIFSTSGIEPMELTPGQLLEVEELKERKYSTWDWNFGKSPAFNMKKELKFPAGLVSVHMESEKGHIKEIRFYGDFFGNGDISELESSLKGLPLDVKLKEKLEKCDIGAYMNGISAGELYSLLTH